MKVIYDFQLRESIPPHNILIATLALAHPLGDTNARPHFESFLETWDETTPFICMLVSRLLKKCVYIHLDVWGLKNKTFVAGIAIVFSQGFQL